MVRRRRGNALASVHPLTFRAREGIDLTLPRNRWLKPHCEAVQITADNAVEVMAWCGGEPAIAPGKLIALKGWTGTWQTAGVGDWIVLVGDILRVIYENDFANNYEEAK